MDKKNIKSIFRKIGKNNLKTNFFNILKVYKNQHEKKT